MCFLNNFMPVVAFCYQNCCQARMVGWACFTTGPMAIQLNLLSFLTVQPVFLLIYLFKYGHGVYVESFIVL